MPPEKPSQFDYSRSESRSILMQFSGRHKKVCRRSLTAYRANFRVGQFQPISSHERKRQSKATHRG